MKDEKDDLFTDEDIVAAFGFGVFPVSVEHSFVEDPKDKRFNVGTRTGALICAGTPRPTTREQAEVNRKNANLPSLPKL